MHKKNWGKGMSGEKYSDLGLKIFAYSSLLKSKDGGSLKSNEEVRNQSQELSQKDRLPPGIKPIKYEKELRTSLKVGELAIKAHRKRAEEIVETLLAMLKLKGIQVVGELTYDAFRLYVPFKNIDEEKHPIRPLKVDSSVLGKYGVETVIPEQPVGRQEFMDLVKESYELRILQSAFYDQHQIVELIDEAITMGILTRVKILLAQPHSDAAKERAHTYGKDDIDQLPFFNSRILEAITRLQRIQFKHKDKVNPETQEKVLIEIRLYARPPVIPIYHLLDASGRTRMIRFGVFWRHRSSFDSPHFQLWGKKGLLKDTIEDHFDAIWNDLGPKNGKGQKKSGNRGIRINEKAETEKTREAHSFDFFDGHDEAFRYSRSYTIDVDLAIESITALRDRFDDARQVRFLFPWAIKQRADYLYFKCYYFKPHDKASSCALRFDRNSSTVIVSNTNQNSVYRGVAIRRHNSFAMFLVGVNEGANQRIMTLNIPVGSGTMDRNEHFAIYSNINIDDGSPYSQLMLLHQIDKATFDARETATNTGAVSQHVLETEDKAKVKQNAPITSSKAKNKYDAVDEEIDLSQYLPYLKDRRISLPSLLWNRPRLKVDQTQGNYQQFFSAYDHSTYFSLLIKEVASAKANIYFFGYPPSSDYEGDELDEVREYYDTHSVLLSRRNKPVDMHRYVLDPDCLEGAFVDYLKELFEISDAGQGGQFRLHLAKEKYPVDADLILIDPDTAKATCISSYMRERLIRAGKIPIRLDVIKDGTEIQRHKLNFCLSFNKMKHVDTISTLDQLEAVLKQKREEKAEKLE